MAGDNRNRWTPEQLARMVELRAWRTPWAEIAIELGHPLASCRQRMVQENNARRREAAKLVRHKLRETADRANAPLPIPGSASVPLPQRATARDQADYARSSISTAKLIADSELRARIEVMGITGGLLGDPLPGRSALDRRRQ